MLIDRIQLETDVRELGCFWFAGVLREYFECLMLDAVLMELSAPHPNLTVSEEADLKGRLLRVLEANATQHEFGELIRLLREAISVSEFQNDSSRYS